MNWDTLAAIVLGALGGGAFKTMIDKGFDWLRFREKDKAETHKSIHDSQNETLTITTGLLGQWIQIASMAESKLSEKDGELREVQHALGLCKESMERCRKMHGCSE